ncbi:hypothetical protein BEP19_09575 [Ammoniphilus oxalaticus]|uniref:TVP38/TMEM64 family membrane protein n=1 Tax=Ammoniphilus oxalaticus TaxID=66863 RepID=A0A419SL63_9BACL|nr:hypothetical protein BEP19_09575 [Ammoniphilus oxalaticus]
MLLINLDGIVLFLHELGPWAFLFGSGLIVVQTFAPIVPFLVLVGANVFVFGLWGGFLLSWIGAVCGAILMFIVARTVGRNWAQQKLSEARHWQKLDHILDRNGFKTVFALRLVPIIPAVVVNLAAGLSTVRTRMYILATALGKIPLVFAQCFIGHDLLHFSNHKSRLMYVAVGCVLIFAVALAYARKKWKLS